VTETPEVARLPALAAGRIAFGSLNNFRKMSPEVLSLWAEVLAEVPESTLTMLCPPGNHRQQALRIFETRAVNPARVTLVTHLSGPDYLRKYHEIDIALDPFPYNGITTTLDALYMGVPVLTLTGRTAPSRASWAILHALGMDDWVTHTPEEFIVRARTHAAAPARLAALRAGLRQKMQASPVMDARGFAARMESAYRVAWQNWARHG
jgi:predicted O-linked N-acetylglucosamine transferase (SPINDLY family)